MRGPRAGATTDHAAGAEGSRRAWAALVEQQVRLKSRAARLSATRAKDVHDARVAARRLRSLLATYRPLLDERRSRLLRRQLRDFARALSALREADVRRDLLLALAKHGPGLGAADAGRLRVLLRWSCAESRRALRGAVATQDWAALVATLGDERTLAALRVRDRRRAGRSAGTRGPALARRGGTARFAAQERREAASSAPRAQALSLRARIGLEPRARRRLEERWTACGPRRTAWASTATPSRPAPGSGPTRNGSAGRWPVTSSRNCAGTSGP